MGKYNGNRLNTKVLAIFFAAVFFLCAVNAVLLSYLLRSLEQEISVRNREQLKHAQIKLDELVDAALDANAELAGDKAFLDACAGKLDHIVLTELYWAANSTYRGKSYIHGWTVFLQESDCVVSDNGVYLISGYDGLRSSSTYCTDFWKNVSEEVFYRRFYSAEEFTYRDTSCRHETACFLPLVLKSYRTRYAATTILYLDMETICLQIDPDLQEGFYIFSNDGKMLYTSDDIPKIDSIPEKPELLLDSERFFVTRSSTLADGSLQCVRLVPESEATSIIRSSLMFCLVAVVGSLLAVSIFVLLSIRKTMRPVNGMLRLLEQHSNMGRGNVREAQNALSQLLKQREQQEAELALRDAELSEYFLQSRMKDVYVDMNRQLEIEGDAYILYIQVLYRREPPEAIRIPRAELENCLQEMMSGSLSKLFETAMVFQLEPGRFAARVTLPKADDQISRRMERFMERLENERDFAWFNVVQSERFSSPEELPDIYSQLQETARTAHVCDRCQLIRLPVEENAQAVFVFSHGQEKKLYAHMCAGEADKAEAFVREILQFNLQRGISHIQMEILCVAIVNTAAYAVTELTSIADNMTAASGVYNALTAKCSTAEDYCDTVIGFVRSLCGNEVQITEDEPLLQKIQQYLQDNYSRDFSSDEMADALYVSRKYLSAYYKSKTGMNLSESIQLFRIKKAVELLKDPEVRIGDVGPMVGIPSARTFLRQFRKYTGTTPKEYRLMHIP